MLNTTRETLVTFAAAVVFGCTAAVAIASGAAISQSAPMLRSPVQTAQPEVIRLEPVVVTMSKKRYDAIRSEEASRELARSAAAKVARG